MTGWALGELPVVVHQCLEVVVVPLGRSGVPGTFETARGGVYTLARSEVILPAQELLLHRSALWFGFHEIFGASTVHLAEGVTADNQGNGFFVVHCHTAERFANVATGTDWIRVAVGAFRVYIDETHLHGTKW